MCYNQVENVTIDSIQLLIGRSQNRILTLIRRCALFYSQNVSKIVHFNELQLTTRDN